jgi:uncharacterized protein DUF3302
MAFTLQGFGPFLHWLTLVVLCVMPVLAAIVLYKLGGLPGAIAKARGHPQASAINICGWMGIITIVLWPIAMVWAHLSPAKAAGADDLSETDITSLVDKLRQVSLRIAAIESKLAQSGA